MWERGGPAMFWVEDLGSTTEKVRGRLEDIIKINIHEIGWIDLAENRNTWRAPVKVSINLHIS